MGFNSMTEELKFHLEYFDGPLDLLLHLIKDSKIDVETVFLSEVTEQFLEYMNELDRVEMEVAAEFLSVASTLLEVKSKALLPRYEAIPDDIGDDAEELLRRLEEYRLIKNAGKNLKELEDISKYYRVADENIFKTRVNFQESNVNVLLEAFRKVLLLHGDDGQNEKVVKGVIPKDYITIAQQTKKLKIRLKLEKKASFFALFSEKAPKIEIVVTFLAILEMIKNQEILVEQSKEFNDIEIELNEG